MPVKSKTEMDAEGITVIRYASGLVEILVGTIDILNPESNGEKTHSYLAWAVDPDNEGESGVHEAFRRGLVHGGVGVFLTNDAELRLPESSPAPVVGGGLTDDMANLCALMARRHIGARHRGEEVKFAYALNAEEGLMQPTVVSVSELGLAQEVG